MDDIIAAVRWYFTHEKNRCGINPGVYDCILALTRQTDALSRLSEIATNNNFTDVVLYLNILTGLYNDARFQKTYIPDKLDTVIKIRRTMCKTGKLSLKHTLVRAILVVVGNKRESHCDNPVARIVRMFKTAPGTDLYNWRTTNDGTNIDKYPEYKTASDGRQLEIKSNLLIVKEVLPIEWMLEIKKFKADQKVIDDRLATEMEAADEKIDLGKRVAANTLAYRDKLLIDKQFINDCLSFRNPYGTIITAAISDDEQKHMHFADMWVRFAKLRLIPSDLRRTGGMGRLCIVDEKPGKFNYSLTAYIQNPLIRKVIEEMYLWYKTIGNVRDDRDHRKIANMLRILTDAPTHTSVNCRTDFEEPTRAHLFECPVVPKCASCGCRTDLGEGTRAHMFDCPLVRLW
jgi:hypothetical protein